MKVKTSDAAGNQGTATKVVTVSAPTTGGGGGGGGSTPPPSGGGGGGGSTPPAGGGSTGGGGATDGGDLEDEPADADEADFEVSAPRKLKLAKGKLPITTTTDTPGKVSVALVRNGRVVARGSKSIAEGTATYKLKLPRKAKAGRHTLKVTFKPTGGEAITETVKVQLTGKAKKAKASAAGARRAARLVRRPGRAAGRRVPRHAQAQLRAARPRRCVASSPARLRAPSTATGPGRGRAARGRSRRRATPASPRRRAGGRAAR